MGEMVKRCYPMTMRSDENVEGKISGVPIVLESPTDIGGWYREIIRNTAIKPEVLKREIHLYKNHDLSTLAMASTLIPIDHLGGMTLEQNGNQIEMNALLNLKRNDSNDFYYSIKDNTTKGMSFMFHIKSETWEDLDTDYPTRYIDEIDEIVEVSGVNHPAYKQTSIGVRSVEAAETDLAVLEKMRSQFKNKRSGENATDKELELSKIKAKYLY